MKASLKDRLVGARLLVRLRRAANSGLGEPDAVLAALNLGYAIIDLRGFADDNALPSEERAIARRAHAALRDFADQTGRGGVCVDHGSATISGSRSRVGDARRGELRSPCRPDFWRRRHLIRYLAPGRFWDFQPRQSC